MNAEKSIHVKFTKRSTSGLPLLTNNGIIPQKDDT